MPPACTDGPDEGLTAGSMSVARSGAAVRRACAEVRALFVAEAVALGLDADAVTVRAGRISDGRRTTSYGELAVRVDLDRVATGTARPKAVGELRIVGTSAPRLDLPDKIAGRPRYLHDLVLPGQLHGRVVRPPSPAATLDGIDLPSLPGVTVVRDGSFLGVIATNEEAADLAADELAKHARWHERDTLPDEDDLPAYLRAAPAESTTIADSTAPKPAPSPTAEAAPAPGATAAPDGSAEAAKAAAPSATESADGTAKAAMPGGAGRHAASYSRPFLAHASIAPSCGIARWDGDHLTVWTHSQGIHDLRAAIARALDLDPGQVRVQHAEGAGCYGHNGADDAAFDAVLLARAVPGRPVRVRWSRRDELTWSPFGSAMAIDVAATVDADGGVVSWEYDVWSQGHTARPGYAGSPGLLAAAHLARPHVLPPPVDPPPARGAGTARNAVPIYAFNQRRISAHRVLSAPLRSSALRSLGAFANVFAIESFMDELALAAGDDPLSYRLKHLTDPRARDVLTTAAGMVDRTRSDGTGYGIGLARYKDHGAYCAVVAEVEAVHEIRVRRLAVAADLGLVVNPDGARNQLEGGAVQSTSWTVKERVRFDRRRVTSADWESYPILRFSEVPRVDVALLDRPDQPSVGAGEAAQGPTAAAIANAVADALSVRIRDLPITTDRVIAALQQTRD